MKGIVYSLLFSLRYSFSRKKVLEVFKLPGQTFRERLIFASSHVGMQGRHGVFLADKEATLVAGLISGMLTPLSFLQNPDKA